MTTAKPLLFQPHTIRGVTLPNRTVLAPMVHYRAIEGVCGTFHTVHLGKYVLGGFGLVFTEATAIEKRGMVSDMDLGIFNETQAQAFKPLLAKLKDALKDKAEDVRVTSRLVDSPACLVVQDDGMSTQLARMLKQAGQSAPESKPVLEVNPEHPLVKKLDGSVHFHDLAHILFDQALLAEGGLPDDPAAYVRRVNALLA